MTRVAELRRQIDVADEALVAALTRRFALTDQMRALKAELALPPKDEKREAEILARVVAAVPAAYRDTAAAVYERLFGASRGEIEVIARGVAIREGKVLLCRAKGGQTTYLPGGHVEFGETGAVALAREIAEELGVTCRVGELLGVLENAFDQHGRHHAEVNLVYRLELEGAGSPEAREDWIEFEWRALDELSAARLLPAGILSAVGIGKDEA